MSRLERHMKKAHKELVDSSRPKFLPKFPVNCEFSSDEEKDDSPSAALIEGDHQEFVGAEHKLTTAFLKATKLSEVMTNTSEGCFEVVVVLFIFSVKERTNNTGVLIFFCQSPKTFYHSHDLQ